MLLLPLLLLLRHVGICGSASASKREKLDYK
jgi:hypothetical protein